MSPNAARLLASCMLISAACVDPLVVGEQPACEPQCPAGLHCNPELEQCVQCTIDDECVGRFSAPYCEGFGCVQCRGDEDCTSDRTCNAGTCIECVQDADCQLSVGFERFEMHVCELGACVDQYLP